MKSHFERIILSHWSYAEMREAFGFTIEQLVYYGAYPGAAELIDDPERWMDYISGAIVDATINKIGQMNDAGNTTTITGHFQRCVRGSKINLNILYKPLQECFLLRIFASDVT